MSFIDPAMSPDSPTFITSLLPRGVLEIRGKDALDLLHRLSATDIIKLKIGECCPAVFTTEKGRIVDYVVVGRGKETMILLTTLGREGHLKSWIEKYTIMEDVQSEVLTHRYDGVMGVGEDLPAMIPDEFCNLDGIDAYTINNNGFSLIVRDFDLTWTYVFCTRREEAHALRAAMSARSIVVMESPEYKSFLILRGIPEGTLEFREEFNPFEAGISHAISFTKGCYIGQEVIARLDTYNKVQRRLVGLRSSIYVPLTSALQAVSNGVVVGWITSASPVEISGGFPTLGIIRNEIQVGDTVSFGPEEVKAHGTVVDFNHRSHAQPTH